MCLRTFFQNVLASSQKGLYIGYGSLFVVIVSDKLG